ncbi:PilT protein domain protein [Xylanimonas cellulosilytica DSM 15894]|uniref:Ribonuclease VapC n=1 Tax=Xylanimonas cellulosilytica (strain DSM 15894 / JCM 12276 / CECT 5975 / KCTC 9989 / LMG 20990 / NBRC 107835 / XIL07) TaxID=446471 RepID=D1BTV3_XYLCX|nr:type II toxin-antitoxin system VapC family toxin [Xylanimonas cellulosilytica]ACZ29117.1 PilT protein domain protein [Xylanimonas cellulosilytica DSM 15894]
MILLDTNVVAELMKARPDVRVEHWAHQAGHERMWASSPVVGELTFGALRLPPGRRRSGLLDRLTEFLGVVLDGRLASFGPDEALAYGRIKAARERAGRVAGDVDVMVAAIAVTRGGCVATRNVRHFEGFGVDVVNPWEAS